MKASEFISDVMVAALPKPAVRSVVEWSAQFVRLIGSARSEAFNPDITPWSKRPLERAAVPHSRTTYVKPIQSGGSVVGECAICYWIANENGGDIAYYWQNDEKASDRWKKRLERILLNCAPVVARITDRGPDAIPDLRRSGKWTNGIIQFPHANFSMLGVKTTRNVASESVRFEVNEEIHDTASGWEPGRLEQAYGRTTAYWNSVILNISNAGKKNSDLHKAFLAGTQRQWQVRCPGCGGWHVMRTRWEDERPDLGGLRYNADGCRLDNGDYNYTRLAETIRYQMPCGYVVHEDSSERRSLSLAGHYGEPQNPGATEESFTLEAVSVDYIPWLDLVKQKHQALKAMRSGDAQPYFDYLRERECIFVDDSDRPIVHRIVLSDSTKDRAGLPNRLVRFGALDRQQGAEAAGELPHWWGLIQDVAEEFVPANREQAEATGVKEGAEVRVLHVLTVWEGKLLTNGNAVDVMARHDVRPSCVVVDSGWDTRNVYGFCLEHGYSCVKDEDTQRFSHPDGVKRIYSPEEMLALKLNMGRTRDRIEDEPAFWFVSKYGMLDRLAWMRTSPLVIYEVPKDVSADFISHMDSWSFETRKVSRSKETVGQWVQHKKRDDLLKCACYISVLIEMAGLIGTGVER